jgi:hypothetical protein
MYQSAGNAGEQRIDTMADKTIGLDETEDETLTSEISDDVLEAAAATGQGRAANFTISFCSGAWVCPTYLGGWACY